jgi:hypothetical protein
MTLDERQSVSPSLMSQATGSKPSLSYYASRSDWKIISRRLSQSLLKHNASLFAWLNTSTYVAISVDTACTDGLFLLDPLY